MMRDKTCRDANIHNLLWFDDSHFENYYFGVLGGTDAAQSDKMAAVYLRVTVDCCFLGFFLLTCLQLTVIGAQ